MRRATPLFVGIFGISCAGDDTATDFAAIEPQLFAAASDAFVPAGAPANLVDANNQPIHPVHANLMRDGRVLLIGKNGNAGLFTPTPLGSPVPATVQLAAATAPVEIPYQVFDQRYTVAESLFCSGHTQLADGTFFTVGGTRYILDGGTNLASTADDWIYVRGLAYGTRFDGATWTSTPARLSVPNPSGDPSRWYPQATKLPDGRVLVLNGYEMPMYGPDGGQLLLGPRAISAEIYDPVARTFTPFTDSAHTPVSTFNPDYSHPFILPYVGPVDGYVLGESSAPSYFLIDQGAWYTHMAARPGNVLQPDGLSPMTPNNGASSVMLPIRLANSEWGYFNGAALVAGGSHNTPNEHSIDRFDPITNSWLARIDMEVRRHHPSTVLLPDGKVLVIAGHDDTATSGDRIRRAIHLDPATGFSITEGTAVMGEVRGYHTFTVLLPDGRVLVGGGRTAGPDRVDDEKPNFRYYHPPYLNRPRPTLSLAPAVLRYGQTGTIAHSTGVTDVVLIALGSMTHSFDSHQRYVQLARTPVGTSVSTVAAPPNPETAPPGYYMMFVLDAARTPSVARIVQVTP
jgi:hypothetical protein